MNLKQENVRKPKNISLSAKEVKKYENLANKLGISFSALVRMALKEFHDKYYSNKEEVKK